MKSLSKFAALGAAMSLLTACGGGYTSKVEDLIENCWAPGLKRQTGVADMKIHKIQISEDTLSEADKQNGFTWVASVTVEFTYRERSDGPWQESSRMPSAAVREGKLRLERADGIKCETDA